MKDRVPKYPGRMKLMHSDGTVEYVTIERADEPVEEGTPLNKASLLSDDTAVMLGFQTDDDPTVDEALKKLAIKADSTEIGHVFTPSKIVGYNAATIASYFKKKDEIIVDESMFSLDFYDPSITYAGCRRVGISPNGKDIVEFFSVCDTSRYYLYICHTHITEDGEVERYGPINTNEQISGNVYSIGIYDMDNDCCIFGTYYSQNYVFCYNYSTRTITKIAEKGYNNAVGTEMAGYGFGNLSATLMDSDKKILHFHVHNNDYCLFFSYANADKYAYAYNKSSNSYKEICSVNLDYSAKSHMKIFKTPIGIGKLQRLSTTIDSETHQRVDLTLYDWEGNEVVSQVLSDYIYSGSDSVFDTIGYGCWGNEESFYIALKDTKTKDAAETVIDGTGTYRIVENSGYVCTKISTTVQPNYYRNSNVVYNSVEISMLHTHEGTPYLTNTTLYHSDLYDKLLTPNGVALSETYRDQISQYKAVPFYGLPLSDAAVSSTTALTTLTPMERETTCTLGMVRKLGDTDWYMGNSIELIKWFLFKFDESKLIPIKI